MRLDAYIRVSRVGGREGDSFISPQLQRERCEGVAKAGGHTIVEWHEDLDRPGSDATRPGFQAALGRVDARDTDGIVVARLDRFARSVADAATALKRIDSAGGALLSAHESLDTSSSFGRFAMHMMLSLAELELDRIREGWDAARASAVAKGIHVASRTPTGYERGEDRRLLPTGDAPAIVDVFKAKAAGASWAELSAILEAAGVRTPYGGTGWTTTTLRHMLSNRVYLGEARSGEHFLPGAHDAIIDPALWAQAQHQPRLHVQSRSRAMLGGMIRCAGCRHVMKSNYMTTRKGERVRIYSCRGKFAAGRCGAKPAVMASIVEPWVIEQFFARVGDIQAEAKEQTAELIAAEAVVAEAEAELEAFLDADVSQVVGVDRYRRGLTERQRRLEESQAALAQIQAATENLLPDTPTLTGMWPDLSDDERRQLLASAIDAVFLRRVGQANVPISSRALVLWRGEAPDDLPGRGHGRWSTEIRPFDWPG